MVGSCLLLLTHYTHRVISLRFLFQKDTSLVVPWVMSSWICTGQPGPPTITGQEGFRSFGLYPTTSIRTPIPYNPISERVSTQGTGRVTGSIRRRWPGSSCSVSSWGWRQSLRWTTYGRFVVRWRTHTTLGRNFRGLKGGKREGGDRVRGWQ